MANVTKQNRIKAAVENKLVTLLKSGKDVVVKKEDLQILGLSVKYLAVAAKLEESEWGSELDDLNEAGDEDEPETDS